MSQPVCARTQMESALVLVAHRRYQSRDELGQDSGRDYYQDGVTDTHDIVR